MKTSPVLTTRQEREKVLRGGKSGGWERDVIPYNPLLPPQWGAGSVPPSRSALPYEVCYEISKRSQQGGDGTCLREMWLWAEDKWGQQLKTCRRWPGASRETPKITDCVLRFTVTNSLESYFYGCFPPFIQWIIHFQAESGTWTQARYFRSTLQFVQTWENCPPRLYFGADVNWQDEKRKPADNEKKRVTEIKMSEPIVVSVCILS